MSRKKLLVISGLIICIAFMVCFIAIYKNAHPLVDDYGQELTPIAEVGIKTTFLDLFDNCVLPNGEPETWESLDPRKVSINIPSYEKVKPTFPLLLGIHENKQMDILYDIFLVRGNYKPYQNIPVPYSDMIIDKPYVMVTKNCCPLYPYPKEKKGVRCNAEWCFFIADSVNYPGKYKASVNPIYQKGYWKNDMIKDDILQYPILFPDGVTMDNLRKIILEVREFGDTDTLLYMSIDKEDLEIRDVYEKDLGK